MTDGNKPAIDGDWFEFTFGGKEYAVEVAETIEFLTLIDRDHDDDENECLDCRELFALTPEMKAVDHVDRICPACSSKAIRWNEAYLDDVSAHLTKRAGMPRCSRTEARRFYFAIVEAYNAKKNENSPDAGSLIGTESIPPGSVS